VNEHIALRPDWEDRPHHTWIARLWSLRYVAESLHAVHIDVEGAFGKLPWHERFHAWFCAEVELLILDALSGMRGSVEIVEDEKSSVRWRLHLTKA
jgi:hypothetical protein